MKIIKAIIKRIFCKHEYHYLGEVIWNQEHDITVECKKCGKKITLIYQKDIDK